MNDDHIMAALARLEDKLDTGLARVETGLTQVETGFARLDTGLARLESEQTRMREQFGNKLDDILDKLRAVREDTENTQAHVLFGLQQNLTLGQRITKLEEQMRRAGH